MELCPMSRAQERVILVQATDFDAFHLGVNGSKAAGHFHRIDQHAISGDT